ncbi:hypothetical protein [Morganella morganii]|uniref:hypothetical protein n=1 Tax=Morganella morganii TaxID=582 RepID=UPI000468AD12|nr:hypothetical protein [Morganella morganii]
MKERGMIFNSEMVRAILNGRKTQTRHVMNNQPCYLPGESNSVQDNGDSYYRWLGDPSNDTSGWFCCPLGKVGNRLWVRETFQVGLCTETTIAYKATHKPSDLEEGWHEAIKWRPSTQMPRWASRILLEITAVRVEHLQDISEEDAVAEGVVTGRYGNEGNWMKGFYAPGGNQPHQTAKSAYSELWCSIYGVDAWYKNPWVWCITFKQIQEE